MAQEKGEENGQKQKKLSETATLTQRGHQNTDTKAGQRRHKIVNNEVIISTYKHKILTQEETSVC